MKLIFMFCALISVSTTSFSEVELLPGPIISTEWLVENRDRVVILDVRKQIENYSTEGHIQDAILVDVSKIRVTRNIDGKQVTRVLPERSVFDSLMQKLGLSNNDLVVLTHEGNTPGDLAGAARLYWQLKVYGFERVALLDGGNKAWVDALEDLTTDKPKIDVGTFSSFEYNSNIIATTKNVEAAIANQTATLIDTRSLRYHIGLSQKDYVYASGHISPSKNFPYKFVTPLKGATNILPIKQIEMALISIGINPRFPLILYCNSGYECSNVWFVMYELFGNKNVAIYDGALHEWTMDNRRPMTTKYGQ